MRCEQTFSSFEMVMTMSDYTERARATVMALLDAPGTRIEFTRRQTNPDAPPSDHYVLGQLSVTLTQAPGPGMLVERIEMTPAIHMDAGRDTVCQAEGGDEGRSADDGLRFTSAVDNVTCGPCLAQMAMAASEGGVVCTVRHVWAETECGGNVKRHETAVGTIWECERCGCWRADRDIAVMNGVRTRT